MERAPADLVKSLGGGGGRLPPLGYAARAASLCQRCGACLQFCPSYSAFGDVLHSPPGRFAALWRRDLELWYKAFSTCTLCKACAYVCPLGLNAAEASREARSALFEAGYAPAYVAKVVSNFLRTGNNLGMPPAVVEMAVAEAAERVRAEKGKAPSLYFLDGGRPTAQVGGRPKRPALLFPSSSDVFEFTETLKGYLYFLAELGYDAVVDLRLADTANYGYYLSDSAVRKIADMYAASVERADPELVVFGECGHGWFVFSRLVAPRLRTPVAHMHQLLAAALRRGELRLDPSKNSDAKPLVYMDPCNYVRAGLVDEPREVLRHAVSEFAEWPRNREFAMCCLGGGGPISPETAKTAASYWSKHVVSLKAFRAASRPCATCKAQLKRVFKALGLGIEVHGVVDLAYRAAI